MNYELRNVEGTDFYQLEKKPATSQVLVELVAIFVLALLIVGLAWIALAIRSQGISIN